MRRPRRGGGAVPSAAGPGPRPRPAGHLRLCAGSGTRWGWAEGAPGTAPWLEAGPADGRAGKGVCRGGSAVLVFSVRSALFIFRPFPLGDSAFEHKPWQQNGRCKSYSHFEASQGEGAAVCAIAD